MSFGVIAVVLILIVVTIYLVVFVIYPGGGKNDVLPTLTPLSSKKDIVMPDVTQKTLLGNNGCTVMGMFNFRNGDRTAKYGNNYIPFLQIANNWYLEVSNAPNDKQNTSARLRVRTNGQGTSTHDEMIELPPIPKQKWIFIAILRDGRRFDVIYDNKIVASHRLEHYPVVISSPVSVGNTGLDGAVIHVVINGVRMTPTDIERTRLTFVDTNQLVLEDNTFNASLPTISLLAQCPPGLPCKPITQPPVNQILKWSTPYA
uniref:Lectin/glucanase superfamily protein n=1 Tax=viral metagenome TaxID=1070528 RepID=A0A6C0KUF8_9ZZZZ